MSPLKLSVSEWCYYKPEYDPAAYYRRLREIGFGGVEMVAPERFALAQAAGLELVNISAPGMTKGLNRAEHHAELLPQIRACIATAVAHNIRQVIIFTGNRDGQADETGLQHCIDAGKQLARDAEKAGVTLTLEVLNKFDHPDYQADNSRFAFEFTRAVSSPRVKVLYDIYHMARMGEAMYETILKHLEDIAHFHIAGSPQRNFPGPAQDIDYRSIVNRVTAAGYRGYWGQEFLPAADSLSELERAHALFESW